MRRSAGACASSRRRGCCTAPAGHKMREAAFRGSPSLHCYPHGIKPQADSLQTAHTPPPPAARTVAATAANAARSSKPGTVRRAVLVKRPVRAATAATRTVAVAPAASVAQRQLTVDVTIWQVAPGGLSIRLMVRPSGSTSTTRTSEAASAPALVTVSCRAGRGGAAGWAQRGAGSKPQAPPAAAFIAPQPCGALPNAPSRRKAAQLPPCLVPHFWSAGRWPGAWAARKRVGHRRHGVVTRGNS